MVSFIKQVIGNKTLNKLKSSPNGWTCMKNKTGHPRSNTSTSKNLKGHCLISVANFMASHPLAGEIFHPYAGMIVLISVAQPNQQD